MRPRHALTLLALALPLPVIITGVPHPTSTAGAAREPLRDSLGTTPVITATPSPRPRATRPAPRRTASRSHRAAAHRHHVARPTPTTVRAHRSTHTTTTHTTAPRTSTSTSYPWAGDTSGGNDPWGFTKRQCVSYVAWRLDRAGRSVSTSRGWGSASGWDDVARRKGITVSSRPTVGSVAQWNAGERSTAYVSGSASGSFVAGSYGHVAWVTKVYSDGSVQVAQYNGDGSRSYSTMHVRAPRYLRL